MDNDYYKEDFEVYLYKNNLWLKGKKNFIDKDYSGKFIRFTYAEDFTFNIFETEIRDVALANLPKITFSIELNQTDPKALQILKINTYIGSEKEDKLHTTKMSYPKFIIRNMKTYKNLIKVEMPTEIYKKKHLENEFDMCMLNCRLYVISKYLKSKIYFGNHKLKYDLWAEYDEPDCSLELCPRMNQKLNLDEVHEDSDGNTDNDTDNDYTLIQERIDKLSVHITNLNKNVIELQSKLHLLSEYNELIFVISIACLVFIVPMAVIFILSVHII